MTKDLTKKLFKALDDEVLFCIVNQLEVSELSIVALKFAEKSGVGKSEALKLLGIHDPLTKVE